MANFGWSLPPGCGTLPGEEPTPPCDVCGGDVDGGTCICPECPVCHEAGNPDCYYSPDKPDTAPRHGTFWRQYIPLEASHNLLEVNRYQLENRARVDAWLEAHKEGW